MSARRHVFRRKAVLERWRLILMFRWNYGFDRTIFEFELRVGRPRRVPHPMVIRYEGGEVTARAIWDEI